MGTIQELYSSHAFQTSLKLIQFFGGGLSRSARGRGAGDRSRGKVTKMEGPFTLMLSHLHDRKESG